MNIGLYFGSFNPIHVGHLIICNEVLNQAALQKIWLVVSPHNPLKPQASLLNEFDRLHFARVATEDDNRIQVSDVEFHLPRPSFTATTLAHLTEQFPQHQFSIIMGSDSFQNLHKWYNYTYIIANFKILVYERPGFAIDNKLMAQLEIVKAPLLEISATAIRKLINEGKSIRYLVTEAVQEEIEKSNAYK